MRKAEISLSEAFTDAIGGSPDHNVYHAIGKLAAWATGNTEKYHTVTIVGDKQGCLTATYRNTAGEVTYNILADRRDDGSYSFHS